MFRRTRHTRTANMIPDEEWNQVLRNISAVLETSGKKGIFLDDLMISATQDPSQRMAVMLGIFNLKERGYVVELVTDDRKRYYLTPKYYQDKAEFEVQHK